MLLTAGAFAMTSCSDFLSRSPYDEISSEEFWKSEKDLELYATGFIQRMIPAESTITRGDANTDMCALSLATDLLRPDAVVSADNQTGWSENDWINLRRINYMLDNMSKCKGVVSDEVYNHYEGVARFWRAWFYYGKIRLRRIMAVFHSRSFWMYIAVCDQQTSVHFYIPDSFSEHFQRNISRS